jgi:GNAT superfamily N-acetyltransferase
MDIMVRRATANDAAGIAAILRELDWFDIFKKETESATVVRLIECIRLCSVDDSHTVYVAEGEDERIMGYSSVHWLPNFLLSGPEGYVSELFIRESDRGQGVGTLLLESIKREAIERDCSRLMLINMRKRESYHREFYVKKGWIEREGAVNFILDIK